MKIRPYRILSVLAIMIVGSLALAARPVAADSYDVKATVPLPAPTQAAIIDPSLVGITVDDAAITVTGTCQISNPVVVVSLWRQGSMLNSSPCTNGTFSWTMTLQPGDNHLMARTVNATGQYGPDSQMATITLILPVTPPTPTPPASTSPESEAPANPRAPLITAQENAAFNQAAASDLTIVAPQAFSALTSNNMVSLSVIVGGGSTPYNLELNWGDGTIESQTIDQPGTYTFTHRYEKTLVSVVKARITDITGAITEMRYAIIPEKGQLEPAASQNTQVTDPTGKYDDSWFDFMRRNWVAPTIVVASGGIGLASFWLGKDLAMHQLIQSHSMRVRNIRPHNVRHGGVKHK